MEAGSNAPIIIKRKKVIAGGGHHGGAWKVAYADFVTAMMAFFMLMWLLNATTEQQRMGIADYFSPTIPVSKVSGGGNGMFGASDVFSTQSLAQTGTGGIAQQQGQAVANASDAEGAAETAALQDLEAELLGLGGESTMEDNVMRHVVTRMTDEGLVVELFDLPQALLFEGDTAVPTDLTRQLAEMLNRVFAKVTNDIAIDGHVRSQSILRIDYPVWDLSTNRAVALRKLLEENGTDPSRIARQTGEADRKPADEDIYALRNNRIELIILRSDPLGR